MKKFFFILVITIIGATKGFSQFYYNPYNAYNTYNYNYGISAQAFYDPCVQATIRSAQLANQIYQQSYQYQMNLIQNGYYLQNNSSYNTSNNTSTEIKRTKYVTCDNCNGTGYHTRDVWMGGSEVRKIKSRCSSCHGLGKVRQ